MTCFEASVSTIRGQEIVEIVALDERAAWMMATDVTRYLQGQVREVRAVCAPSNAEAIVVGSWIEERS